jgi:hypothetical protein
MAASGLYGNLDIDHVGATPVFRDINPSPAVNLSLVMNREVILRRRNCPLCERRQKLS